MFDIADIPFSGVSDEEKSSYSGKMKETGSYQGYKPRQYWVRYTYISPFQKFHPTHSTLTTAFTTNWSTTTVRDMFQISYPIPLLFNFPSLSVEAKHLIRPTVNRDVTKRQHPEAVRPFLPEIEAFARHNHFNVLHPILRCATYLPTWKKASFPLRLLVILSHPTILTLTSCSFLQSRLLARGLELPEDALVTMHGFESVGETYGM
jgi:hypothetical protein